MNAPDLTPYWGSDDRWTEFLLVVVPAGWMPVSSAELAKLVRQRVESDSALHDVVTVAHGPSPDEFSNLPDWERALMSRLVDAGMPRRHFLAPRAVFAVIVVGEDDRDIDPVVEYLRVSPTIKRLHVRTLRCEVAFDATRRRVTRGSISGVTTATSLLIDAYEQQRARPVEEADFLAAVAELAERGTISWDEPIARQAPRPERDTASVRPSAAPEARTPTAEARPEPVAPAMDRPAAAPSRPVRPPVFHRGDDVVLVDSRPALKRIREPEPTDAEAIDWLAGITDAVSLAYLVIVPNEEADARRVNRRHRMIAVQLDQLLATVVADASTDRAMEVAIEVTAAATPLQKHGVLRPAGELVEDDLPKVRAELFNHRGTVDALLSAARRTAVAFRARGVEVLSVHYIFLSSVRLSDTGSTGPDWDRLLRGGRVTWVELMPAKGSTEPVATRRRLPIIQPSSNGFHFVSDRYDVAALVREQSANLYVYDLTPPESPTPAWVADAPAATPDPVARRWWRRGSRV